MRLIFLLFFLSAFFYSVQAQTTYEPLQSQAPIPEQILTASYKKSEKEIREWEAEAENRRARKSGTDYIIQTNFVLDRLLQSPLLLFNTPLNTLLEDIADELLVNDPELRRRLSFFVVKSSVPNAFATDRGDIFFTMGLLARVRTEAELAYIVAHEISHVRGGHSMETFETSLDLADQQRRLGRDAVDVLLEQSNFSKELELAADEDGLKLLAGSSYRLADAISMFEVLKEGYQPVVSGPLTPEMVAPSTIPLPARVWLAEPPEAEEEEEEDDDTYSTHPNLSERIGKVSDQMLDYPQNAGASFVRYQEESFDQLVDIAKMELVRTYILERNYLDALYHCLMLLQDHPDDVYLLENLAYSYYGIGQYYQAKKSSQIFMKSRNWTGEIGRLREMYRDMSNDERTVFSAARVWEIYKQLPDNEMLRLMARDAVEDVTYVRIKEDDPTAYFLPEWPEGFHPDSSESFVRVAFTSFMDDEEFTDHLKRGVGYRIEREKREKYESSGEGMREKRKKEKKEQLSGFSLGLDRAVFFNPEYLRGTVRYSGVEIDYVGAELAQSSLSDHLETVADELDFDAVVMDVNSLGRPDRMQTLHDIYLLETWTDEYVSHPGYMVSCLHSEAIELADRMKTDVFVFMGVLGINNVKGGLNRKLSLISGTGGYGLLFLVLPETAPHALFSVLQKQNETYYFAIGFDVRNYRIAFDDGNFILQKDKEELVKAHIYRTIYMMGREPK